MISLKRKPRTAEPVSEFDAAKARWIEATAKHRELVERAEAMELALKFTSEDAVGRAPQHLREKAGPFLKLAAKRRPKVIEQLADTEVEIEDSTPMYQVDRDLYQAACRRETSRIARDLQPRHRAAVKAIATALEALSLAIEEETTTRAELAHVAPERVSAHLPDCSHDLVVGTLADWNSPASAWARRMRKLSVLE